jgi:hypothetical protein
MENSPSPRRWKELSPGQQRAIIAVGAVTTIWQLAMLWDLSRRPAERVRGSKRAWVLASFVRPFVRSARSPTTPGGVAADGGTAAPEGSGTPPCDPEYLHREPPVLGGLLVPTAFIIAGLAVVGLAILTTCSGAPRLNLGAMSQHLRRTPPGSGALERRQARRSARWSYPPRPVLAP